VTGVVTVRLPGPALVVLGASLFGTIGTARVLGPAAPAAGLALLVLGQGGAAVSATGIVLALGSGASYAGYTLATSRALADGAEPAVATAVTFVVSALTLAPALALTDLSWAASASGVALVGYLALVPTVLAYRLFTVGLRGLRPATASTLALAEPVVATVLGVALLGERLGALGWGGAGLVLAGLVLAARDAVTPSESAPAAAPGRMLS
jgi:DME family drug/metabolite transporter